MTQSEFSSIAPTLPAQPGIYKYYDETSSLLYVGKAKHIRKRVSSYFNKTGTNYKTQELVRRIHHIEYTIVDNEQDAFFLENTLIKEYQPLFNINLKDDKTYPYIVVKNEHFPRVFFTRKQFNDGSVYFGPYASVAKVRDLLEFIRQNIPLRTCNLALTSSNISKGKFKVCLEYHLGNCNGPCEGKQTADDYAEGINRLKHLLKGNLAPVIQVFKQEMKSHADTLEFEKAAIYQQKLAFLHEYKAKSTVVNSKTGTVDVFSIADEADEAYINYLAIQDGSIILTKNSLVEKKLELSAEDVLTQAIFQLRDTFRSEANEIIVPFPIDMPQKGLMITVPRQGDKKKLLDLSQKNADYYKAEIAAHKRLKLSDRTLDENAQMISIVQEDLQLPDEPIHIECFDNSNFQGSNAVAAMVCFRNGLPSKKDYRRYHIKTVEGINDFASMKEVVYRRYKRMTDEGASLPQLVIIDGGKGQLSAAMESITALGLSGRMTLVGLAKQKEELFFAGGSESLQLPWGSQSLQLIRRIRDEVHRFGISFHRNVRSKQAIRHGLDDIPGIGPQTITTLLKTFKSIKQIRQAPAADIENTIGKKKADLLLEWLSSNK
jgi:excinuclease ABC subunit C